MDHRIDNPKYKAAREIVVALRAAGHQAFFAGGCVRDLLLGIEPKDFDVATSATPDVVMEMFAKTYSVGAHFGVVLVCTPDGEGGEIATEVATFRHDGAYSDGRRPDAVRFSTDAREDVLRRDFTINGMLLDPLAFDETGDAAGCDARLCKWPRGSGDGSSACDRGAGAAVCRGQAAYAARGAVCGAAGACDRAANDGCDSRGRAGDRAGELRTDSRRADTDVDRRPRGGGRSSCSTRRVCWRRCCPRW